MLPRTHFDRPIAHRGLHDRAQGIIENSRAAFEAAIAAGFAIECDLQLSADGAPVVFHDDTLERLTERSGPVGALSSAELGQTRLAGSSSGDCPQRLTEFLAQVSGRTLVQIELKPQPGAAMRTMLAQQTVEALAAYDGPVTVQSFDPRLIMLVRRLRFRSPIGIITYRHDRPDLDGGTGMTRRFALRHLLHWPWTRFDYVSCHWEALDLPAVRLFRRFGMPVTAWTIRSVGEERLARAGADQLVFEGYDPGHG